MKVKVIRAFKARGELMPVGTVLNIRDQDYPMLIGKVEPTEPLTTDQLQYEYFALLNRFWQIDKDPATATDETRRTVARLDELYRALHQAGRRVPVRLPVERNQYETKRSIRL
ncbi:MAG: hypothetical protein VB050_18300 [Geobacteraceae bacterium]|nr:hypothetical protein [Geobacteraceae bacterium]